MFALCYALTAVAGTWAFFACFIVFLGNLPRRSDPWLSPTVDVGADVSPGIAVLSNFVLVCLFATQHSVMARPWFKRFLTAHIPAELERATYVHAANVAGFLLIFLWLPIPTPVWTIDNEFIAALMWIGFAIGWLILLMAALSINLFELLGLRQAIARVAGQTAAPLRLKTAWIYRHLAHPMYVGVLMGLWLTPVLTVGHALLATQLTAYVFIGMRYERRDLRRTFGTVYTAWRARSGADRSGAVLLVGSGDAPLPPRMKRLLARLAAVEKRDWRRDAHHTGKVERAGEATSCPARRAMTLGSQSNL